MRECDKQILADHYLDFYRIAYSLLHNETDVEDVVQDALVETMSQPWVRDPFRYCAKVVTNNCIKLLKRNRYVLTNNLPDIPDTSDTTKDEQMLKALWDLKDNLPDRMREVFDLYYEKGYSKHEISRITNTPMPMVKKLLQKGYTRLRKQMVETINKTNTEIKKI